MKTVSTLLATLVILGASVAQSAEDVKATTSDSPFLDGNMPYSIICPLFTILNTGSGYLVYCSAYRHSCDEFPDPLFYIFENQPQPCDCPDGSGCMQTNQLGDNGLRPLGNKVAADGLPMGLNPKVMIGKSIPSYLMKDGEPVYVRMCEFVYFDRDKPDQSKSFWLGLEMKSPISGIEGLKEIEDWQPTNQPHVLMIKHPNQNVFVLRAVGFTNPVQPEPTPAMKINENQDAAQSLK